jgi:hypothetical protein
MWTRRALLWVFVLALTAPGNVVPPAHAEGAPTRPAVVTLGKLTRITAQFHSQVLLRFPENVSLRELESTIEGGGRVAGFVLTNQSQDEDEGGFLVESFILNRCRTPGCPPEKQPPLVRWAEGLKNGVVPAGTHRLYVIADRAPVVVTFRDRYLRGKTTVDLAPTDVDIELRTLPFSPTSSGDGKVFSGGEFTTLEPGRGLGLLGLWAEGSPYLGGAFGDCFYFDKTLAPEEDAAFLPGCPTGYAPSYWPGGPSAAGEDGGFIYQAAHHSLPSGIGGWAASAGSIDTFGAVALWLRF